MRQRTAKLLLGILAFAANLALAHGKEGADLGALHVFWDYPFIALPASGIALIFLSWLALRLELPIKTLSTELLLSLLSLALFFNLLSWYWDGWWHVAIGRHTLYSPPHVLIYVFFGLGLVFSLLLFKTTKMHVFKLVFLSQVVTLYGGLLDIVWHRFFGEEALISAAIVWAPPHLLSFLVTFVAAFALLHVLISLYKLESQPSNYAFMRIVLVAGSVLSLSRVLIFPLEPLGWHALIGPSGATVTVCLTVLFFLYLAYRLPQTGAVLLSMLLFVGFVGFEAAETAPYLTLPPHAQPPFWLHYLAGVFGVFWLDLLPLKRLPAGFIGLLSGFCIYAVYSFFWSYIGTEAFSFGPLDAFALLGFSSFGGLLAGIAFAGLRRRFELI